MKTTNFSKKYLLLNLIFSMSLIFCKAQIYSHDVISEDNNKFSWPNKKTTAISLTFDDARLSQVDKGIPLLNQYGVKGTFYISPGNLKKRQIEWKEAIKKGHEIGNHTMTHPCSGNFNWVINNTLEDFTLFQMKEDMETANNLIDKTLGVKPFSFAYPCGQKFVGRDMNTKSYVPLVSSLFETGRGWRDEGANNPDFCDMAQLYGIELDGKTFADVKKIIEKEKGNWIIFVGHEINTEGKQTSFLSTIDSLCKYTMEESNNIWIDNVHNIARFIKDQRGESPFSVLPVYKNPIYSINDRVNDLLIKMTLEEKVGQLNMPCVFTSQMGKDIPSKIKACREFARGTYEEGVGPGGGFFSMSEEILHNGPRHQAEFSNELQKIAIEETRLGIPLFIIEEGTHGFMASGATIFPEGLAIGSTWNLELVEKIYSVAAMEARSVGAHQLYTLVVEPNRDPRIGRNMEGYSEDPYICSRIAESIVAGMQGNDISAEGKLIAGLAHYPGQSQGIGGLERSPMEFSERQLRQIFLPPWEAGITKAGALGVMATYPSIDGIPAHASKKLLTDILRNEMGFEGLLVSEGFGFDMIVNEGLAADQKEAGAMAIKAGIDVGITYEPAYMIPLIENVNEGKVPMSVIDQAVKRVLKLKFKMGLFENPYVSPNNAEKVSHTSESQQLALQSAREGIVLLKNKNDLLPLDKNIGSIAVIGPNADDGRNQLGDYTSSVIPQDIITVLDGIKNKVSGDVKINYIKGCNVIGTDLNEIEEARKAAKKADVAIVVVGENERRAIDEKGNKVGTNGENRDVANLDLTGMQEELIKVVHSTGTPTIVILINGRPLSIRWTAENIPAILEAWIPGEKGGDAIADILFGEYNPNGRLPITIPRHAGQLPVFYNYNPYRKNMGDYIGYRDMPVTPLYEFGFGLSYTEFEYDNLRIYQESRGIASDVQISVDIKNAGKRNGAEVAQLYINDVISSVVTPYMELKGFEKVWLDPGEKKTVRFKLTPYELSLINTNMERLVEPGEFEIMVGSSSDDIRLKGKFEIYN